MDGGLVGRRMLITNALVSTLRTGLDDDSHQQWFLKKGQEALKTLLDFVSSDTNGQNSLLEMPWIDWVHQSDGWDSKIQWADEAKADDIMKFSRRCKAELLPCVIDKKADYVDQEDLGSDNPFSELSVYEATGFNTCTMGCLELATQLFTQILWALSVE
ncbi:hypothetical protein LY76DRAFT_608247 [Colletotrichum caudatum]|nr:hypothetical protein LY76DRAFT_608247 [Colletotrichum caudatum]